FVKQFCYGRAIFIVEGPKARQSELFPGIVNKYGHPENRQVYVQYYRWVTFCLLLQAACFQAPHFLWKAKKGNHVRRLIERLRAVELVPDEERNARIRMLASHFLARHNCENRRYFVWFVVTQVLYFFNALAQVALTERFLNDQFISLLPSWLMGEPVLDIVFPKMTKCTLNEFGVGGSIQEKNVMCYLSMNVLIEKVYLLLWGAMMLAVVTSVVQVVFIAIAVASRRFRAVIFDEGAVEEPLQLGEWLFLGFVKEGLDNLWLFEAFLNEVRNKRRALCSSRV
ncbi:innexin inx2-like, partial [Tropilaelaps mercedesae]